MILVINEYLPLHDKYKKTLLNLLAIDIIKITEDSADSTLYIEYANKITKEIHLMETKESFNEIAKRLYGWEEKL